MRILGDTMVGALAFGLWLVGCDTPPHKPLARPDPNMQEGRESVLNDLAEARVILGIGPCGERGGGCKIVVGPPWYDLNYEDKRSFASTAGAWYLCKNYSSQTSFVVLAVDWQTKETVATLVLDSGLPESFEVKR